MREYAKAIQTCLAARAIWEPDAGLVPGDGQIVNECFVRLGSVSELGATLLPGEVIDEGKYQFSRGLSSRQGVSATTRVGWIGEVLASLDWVGGAGVFLGAPKSSSFATDTRSIHRTCVRLLARFDPDLGVRRSAGALRAADAECSADRHKPMHILGVWPRGD